MASHNHFPNGIWAKGGNDAFFKDRSHSLSPSLFSFKKKLEWISRKSTRRNKYLEKKESAIGLLDGMPVGRLQVLRSSVGVYIYILCSLVLMYRSNFSHQIHFGAASRWAVLLCPHRRGRGQISHFARVKCPAAAGSSIKRPPLKFQTPISGYNVAANFIALFPDDCPCVAI